jgi:hypothetical protein
LAARPDRGCSIVLKRRLFHDTVAEMVAAKKAPGSVASATSATLRDYGRHWTPVHLDVSVGDLEAAVGRARAAGAALEGELQTYEWGRIAFMAAS